MSVIWTLCQREVVRFFRDRSRVIGAILPPLLFWFFLGAGIGRFDHIPGAPEGLTFLQYYLPGSILLIVLFTAIFATITIIADREEGFMQGVLVAPIPRTGLVFGKILGATSLGFLQGLVFFPFVPFVGLHVSPLGWLIVCATLFLGALGLTGLGFLLAWRMNSTQGFHSIINVFLMPMWMLSGALFPVSQMPSWMKALAMINPMTYGIWALQAQFKVASGVSISATGPSPAICLAALAAFAALTFILSVLAARRGNPPA